MEYIEDTADLQRQKWKPFILYKRISPEGQSQTVVHFQLLICEDEKGPPPRSEHYVLNLSTMFKDYSCFILTNYGNALDVLVYRTIPSWYEWDSNLPSAKSGLLPASGDSFFFQLPRDIEYMIVLKPNDEVELVVYDPREKEVQEPVSFHAEFRKRIKTGVLAATVVGLVLTGLYPLIS